MTVFKIEINETFHTMHETAEGLRKMADLIDKGYMFGVSPVWDLEEAIEQNMDMDLFNSMKEREEEDKRRLAEFLNT